MAGRSTKQAGLLVAFVIIAIVLGVGSGMGIARLQSAGEDGLTQLAVGLGAIIVAVPIAVAVGGLIWAFVFRRAWWFPPLTLLGIFALAIILAMALVTDSVAGYILPVLILLAALTAVFAIGLYAPPARRTRM